MKKSAIVFTVAALFGVGLIAIVARMPAAPTTSQDALWERAYSSWSGWRGSLPAADGIPTDGERALASIASLNASKIMTFNFENADAHFRDGIEEYFTDAGLKNFMIELKKSYIFESVKAQSQTVVANSPPATVCGVVEPDNYEDAFWIVGIPLEVTYTSSIQTRVDKMKLLVMLQRPGGTADMPKIARWAVVP